MTTAFGILAQTGPHGPMGPGGGMHDGMTGGWADGVMGGGLFPWLGPWGGLILLLVVFTLLGAVVYGAIALATRDGRGDEAGGAGADDDALAVLDRRYARGEIDEEEYDARRRQLTRD